MTKIPTFLRSFYEILPHKFQKSQAMVDLPPEIWLEILSHLPSYYIRFMMGVSPTLYALALCDIYREIDMRWPTSETLMQLYELCKHPSLARHVRVLQIGTFAFDFPDGPLLPVPSQSNFSWFATKQPGEYIVERFARQIIPLLTSIDELTLDLGQQYLPPDEVSLVTYRTIDKIWILSSPRLRKLNLRGELEAMRHIIYPALQHPFPALTHLVVSFCTQDNKPSITSQAVVLTLMRSLEPTLESLSLKIRRDLTSLFLYLGHFPRLLELNILSTFPMTPEEGGSIISFLSTHRKHLKTLTLSFHRNSSRGFEIYRNFCNLTFPSLHTLVLNRTQDFVRRTGTFPRLPRLQVIVSGGDKLDNDTMSTIMERCSPSRPELSNINFSSATSLLH